MYLIRVGIWPSLGPPDWAVYPFEPLLVGRSPGCALQLADSCVSALHAQVEPGETGLVLRDLGSKNRTYLNGKAIEQTELNSKDTVLIAGFSLRFAQVELALAPEDEIAAMFRLYQTKSEPDSLLKLAKAWTTASPKDPHSHQALVRLLIQRGDIQKAAIEIEKAWLLAPHDPNNLYLKALLAEQNGRLDSAEEFLRRALEIKPEFQKAQKAETRIESKKRVFAKLGRLAAIKDGQTQGVANKPAFFQSGPFGFYFQTGLHEAMVSNAYAALTRIAKRINEVLGYSPDDVSVVIEENLCSPNNGSKRAAGFYNGKIHLLAAKLHSPDPNFLYVALAHEYIHLAVDRLGKGSCPAWLDEGLAQFLSQNLNPADLHLLKQARDQDALLPLELLERDFALLKHPKLVDLAYAQSHSLVEYLEQRLGWEGIRGLLAGFSKHPDPDRALACYEMDSSSLEQAWIAWLS